MYVCSDTRIATRTRAGFLLVHYEQKLAHLASDEMFGTVYKARLHTRPLHALEHASCSCDNSSRLLPGAQG